MFKKIVFVSLLILGMRPHLKAEGANLLINVTFENKTNGTLIGLFRNADSQNQRLILRMEKDLINPEIIIKR